MKEDKKIKAKDIKAIRIIDIDNKKISKIMEERNKISKEINGLNEDIKKIEKEIRKRGLKMDRLKEKMSPLVDREQKQIPMSQWEIVAQVKYDKGKIQFEIVDFVESYKLKILEQEKNNGKKH